MSGISGAGHASSVRGTVIVACLLMVLGAVTAFAMTPRQRVADVRNPDLEQSIPRSFSHWREDIDAGRLVLPDPSANRLANKIYNKILARTYVSDSGQGVMLAIAYGGDQSDALQLHRPEVCYVASGFKVTVPRYDRRRVGDMELMLARVDATDHYGHEAVTYWMRVGDRQVTTTLDRQLVKIRSGLRGVIPDGILFRVSTRTSGPDVEREYALHDAFITDLLAALDQDTRALLVGQGAASERSAAGS